MKDVFLKKDFSDPDYGKSIKDVDVKKGIVTGYFAAFNNVDLGGDLIEPGAFARTIAARGPQGADRIKFLGEHDTYQKLGKPYLLKEDDYGLYHESKVSQTTLGKDALILVNDGVWDAFSIGYRTTTEKQVNDVNLLKELYLYEGSLVTFPMNENAILTGTKSIDIDAIERRIKQLEKACRDTTASDDTIELLFIHIKQLQQMIIDLTKSTDPPKDTRPDTEKDIAAIKAVLLEEETNNLIINF